MPFGPAIFPALGLSLLKPLLQRAGFTIRVRYGTLVFADLIGPEAYPGLAMAAPHELVGDRIFAGALFPDREVAPDDVDDRAGRDRAFAALVRRARSLVPPFLAAFVDEVLSDDPQIVGFTSTFAQHGASLDAARAIKERRPDVAIVFGGANCEDEMGAELVRRFPFVDAVVSGEGEGIVVALMQRLASRRSLAGLSGVFTASTGDALSAPTMREPWST